MVVVVVIAASGDDNDGGDSKGASVGRTLMAVVVVLAVLKLCENKFVSGTESFISVTAYQLFLASNS